MVVTPPTDLFLSLFWLFLLLEDPGGLPGPLLTGTVVLGGGGGATAEDTGGVGPDLVSSFSDLRLMGAENKETINILRLCLCLRVIGSMVFRPIVLEISYNYVFPPLR